MMKYIQHRNTIIPVSSISYLNFKEESSTIEIVTNSQDSFVWHIQDIEEIESFLVNSNIWLNL